MEATPLWPVITVFVIAGCVKGVTGMGLPTVAMSLLGLWMPAAQAAALLVAPSLATNLSQCRGPHLRPLAARLWPGWVALAAVTALAPGIGSADLSSAANRWLGGVLVGYGLWGLWRPTLPDLSHTSRWAVALAGAATGLVTALTAVFVLPWVPYLQSLRLDKAAMVQALGLSFTVATLALALRLQTVWPPGWDSAPAWAATGAALAGAFAGLWLGERLRGRFDAATFQKALLLVFIALGTANLLRA
ncbi:sulfite exporter TauE/SafE family protein [Roseateles asaccharophilus]|uniref:Probable membrane transporter protein n=1 Tax=Roseateles asaccharophilus TaxID=582607 RepID=A0ABU2A6J9_9BURK|nr:sulfite exporter TauE/SafE family protein [Roseateles asaccharophilus]MDR7332822.1 putative membrane protein YfcA [Roseateles asaccharophilus]